jgi:glutamate/tyrosine decarboxylase-like PLP-dependent enzyme
LPLPEETLDPEDWESLRQLGHRMVDDMIAFLRDVRERPVWARLDDPQRARFREPAPRVGEGAEAAYRDFREQVLPYATGNLHPRFWAWVMGNGTPLAMLAEMLAAGMNCNVAGIDDGANHVEQQVIRWCAELLGFPTTAGGILVSGGSMASLVGLTVARNHASGVPEVRSHGLYAEPRRLVFYGSREMHFSIQKSVELLGLGTDSLRKIPVDGELRMDLTALAEAIARDRAAGLKPAVIIGTAGTTNSGAIDDLAGCAALARREKLWFHVDGAFGAWAALSPRLQPQVRGMELADSLGFDLHKWGWLPYEIGCALVRDDALQRQSFDFTAEYVARTNHHGGVRFGEYGFQLSRGFRALKLWMQLKADGADKWQRLIEQNCAQAQHLAERVRGSSELELIAPVNLNVVCFRYHVPGASEAQLEAHNHALLDKLHADGRFVPSSTTIAGRYALRVCVTNHRTRTADLDALVDEVLALGRAR